MNPRTSFETGFVWFEQAWGLASGGSFWMVVRKKGQNRESFDWMQLELYYRNARIFNDKSNSFEFVQLMVSIRVRSTHRKTSCNYSTCTLNLDCLTPLRWRGILSLCPLSCFVGLLFLWMRFCDMLLIQKKSLCCLFYKWKGLSKLKCILS